MMPGVETASIPTPLRAAFEARDHEVKEITVFFRPFPAVAAFLSVTGPKLGRRRAGAGRAAILRAAGAPVSALMRTTAATGPRLLGIGRDK